MSEHSGRISYKVHKASPETPAEPTLSIFVCHGPVDEHGQILIGDNIVEPEVDAHIADLKRNLDEIGKRAKKELQEARRENLANLKRLRRGQDDGT